MSKVELIEGTLDPGHSRDTAGKRDGKNPTFFEYLSNRNIARKAKTLIESTGRFKIHFPFNLDDPKDMSLTERCLQARKNGSKFFVSIHSNAHDNKDANGTETFIHPNTVASVGFANAIHSNLVKSLGTRDRGLKRAAFGVLSGSYQYMLSCLTEGEFFTNPTQRAWMLQEDYENRYALGIVQGLCSHYGVKAPSMNVLKPKPVVNLPVAPPAENNQLLRVKAKSLWTYNSTKFADRAFTVGENEVFTIKKGPFAADGGTMYQLISGLYITANPEHVEPAGKITPVDVQPKNKLVRIKATTLYTYNSKKFADKSKTVVKRDDVFTVVQGPFAADGGRMYELKSGLFITANPEHVELV